MATEGFILNFTNLMLILCKPFTNKFEKYPNFMEKINCFYMMIPKYFSNAKSVEKIENSPDNL